MSAQATLEPQSTRQALANGSSGGLLDVLLFEQQTTAVDRFAQWHSDAQTHLLAGHYQELIPSRRPGEGEQYAFEVDLDTCSGCKSCVAACHSLNGLEEHEAWRAVGLLHGGSSALPVLRHVTTACHHCLEPACLDGCPVEAYEKDPVTGIVRHLDDQCIGCQYCMLKCPYGVPQYSREKGIVRKCDMCSSRLSAGEAPACVQACPNSAIRISVVETQLIAEAAEAHSFLPGAPEPSYTLPASIYKTRTPLPANLLPADYYTASPQHSHLALVVMLVLTQLSVGAFGFDWLAGLALADGSGSSPTWRTAIPIVPGLAGLAASIAHLGRPWQAYRAVLGWRKSWLSREVLAFGAYIVLAIASAVARRAGAESPGTVAGIGNLLAAATVCFGALGVACSTMIYATTRRAYWNAGYSGLKFALTAVILGASAVLCASLCAAGWSERVAASPAALGSARFGFLVVGLAAALKLSAEAGVFFWLRARTHTPLKRTALLLTGDLRVAVKTRYACGAAGGLVLPAVAALVLLSPEAGAQAESLALLAALILPLNLAGELLERYLFFAAVVAPGMPGVPA